jgi:hypothetical protein
MGLINQLFNFIEMTIYWLDIDCDNRQLGNRTRLQHIEKAGHLVHMERPFVYNKRLKEILSTLWEEGHKKQWSFYRLSSLICTAIIL